MKIYAYCRVSSGDQNTQMQCEAIERHYPQAIMVEETASATSREKRLKLEMLLSVLGEGDKLVVWKLDRLARNVRDLANIVEELSSKGAAIEIIDQKIDTSTSSGKAFLQMLGVFAEFETNLRRERQMVGIEKAKQEGKYKGRKPAASKEEVQQLLTQGLSKADIARKLGISYRTVLRKAS